MSKKQSLSKLLLTFFVCSCFITTYAQLVPPQREKSRVDSIVQMLQQSKSKKGIDTARFTDALTLIEKSTLNDASITLLEKASNQFTNGVDEYWSYRVKSSILSGLIATDKSKALTYGKHNFEVLKKSKTPYASFISSRFLKQLRVPYRNSNMLSEGFQYFNEKLKEYKLNNDSARLADCYYVLSGFYRTIGLLDQAIYNMKKSVSYMSADTITDNRMNPFLNPVGRGTWLNNNGVIGSYYLEKGDYNEAIKYLRLGFSGIIKDYLTKSQNTTTNIASAKLLSGQLDSVQYYLDFSFKNKFNQKVPIYIAVALQVQALYKIETGALDEAEAILQQCWKLIKENNLPSNTIAGTMAPDYYLALIRIEQNRTNEAIALLIKDIERLETQRLPVLRDYKLLAELYEKTGNTTKAKEAYKSFISLQDSLQADKDKYSSLSFETEQEMNEKELSITKLQSENKISALTKNFSFGIAALVLLFAGLVYYRFKSKQKANRVLEETLANLKFTQSQLIQSEKMASLGELTAGIAHEIQNPLNFINNFSEVNTELLDEMEQEIVNDNLEGVRSIATDIKQNEQKISHHGKRADFIVKGMLQHSRTSTGEKQYTNINILADEFLKLSYHGLRAKDKSFNSELITNFDENLPKINVVQQDIGRVLLNLFNNAFYAVKQRTKTAGADYKPIVEVSTLAKDDFVVITVKDNGTGIPEGIKEKIMQPFFTTKPTGEGTGLGLSLSYDIVKGHGGSLTIDPDDKQHTTFIIKLPTVS